MNLHTINKANFYEPKFKYCLTLFKFLTICQFIITENHHPNLSNCLLINCTFKSIFQRYFQIQINYYTSLQNSVLILPLLQKTILFLLIKYPYHLKPNFLFKELLKIPQSICLYYYLLNSKKLFFINLFQLNFYREESPILS